MDYKEFKEIIIDYLSGNLSEEKQKEFELFLAENPQYIHEYDDVKMFWNESEVTIPEPTSTMDDTFYAMLKKESNTEENNYVLHKIENFFFGSLFKRFAYTIAILIFGFFIGTKLNYSNEKVNQKLEIANNETQEVRSQLVLTLLNQSSANKRLQAVNEVNKLNKVTEKIIKALFSTLNNDENVNVRLSAVQALKKYTKIPKVREGLIASIVYQDSPLVQMELADLMVELQEKKAVKSFEKLIEKKEVNSSVKEKIKKSIQSII